MIIMSAIPQLKIGQMGEDNLDGYLNFYSVSGDGRVTNWTIVKTALWYSDIMLITFSKNLDNFSDEIREKLRGNGIAWATPFGSLVAIRENNVCS